MKSRSLHKQSKYVIRRKWCDTTTVLGTKLQLGQARIPKSCLREPGGN